MDIRAPHVMYGRIIVTGCQLTIEPGTNIYGHYGSGIWVRGGTLIAQGNLDNPIVFQGDRLDDLYDDEPGQWGLSFELTDTLAGSLVNYSAFRGGIWLDRAVECELQHVTLSDATVGVWVDSIGPGAEYALKLENSIITQAESIGLLSQSGHIRGFNNLISNCGQACGTRIGRQCPAPFTTLQLSLRWWTLRQFPTLSERLVRSFDGPSNGGLFTKQPNSGIASLMGTTLD